MEPSLLVSRAPVRWCLGLGGGSVVVHRSVRVDGGGMASIVLVMADGDCLSGVVASYVNIAASVDTLSVPEYLSYSLLADSGMGADD